MKNNITMTCLSLTISMFSFTEGFAMETSKAEAKEMIEFDMEVEKVRGFCSVLKVTCNNGRKCYFSSDEVKIAKKQNFKDKTVRLLSEEEAKEYCKCKELEAQQRLLPGDLFDMLKPFWIEGAANEEFDVYSPSQKKGGKPTDVAPWCLILIVVEEMQTTANDYDNPSMWKDLGGYCIESIKPYCSFKNVTMTVVAFAIYSYGYNNGYAAGLAAAVANKVPGFWERVAETRQHFGAAFRLWRPTWLIGP
jgi:predicted house-cleaning noncanonical NTP pyrophosphatase (MazG superfamily)